LRVFLTIILTVFFFPLRPVMAQGGDVLVEKDSVLVLANNNVQQVIQQVIQPSKERTEFKPNPTRAVLYSVFFPGLGQAYNRKYWKLPIVYGGFVGCAYAITWNDTQYNSYKQAFGGITAFIESNGKIDDGSWHNYLRPGETPENISYSRQSELANRFKNQKDYFRRYRDLSIIISVGLYALCILDAYVDAQLFDFDVSPDLSMRVEPVIFNQSEFNSRALGLQCSIKF